MPLRKVNRDPFSNGTEYMWWTDRNCCRCVKAPHFREDDKRTERAMTKCRCAIFRDMDVRMWSDTPIAQRTIDICSKDTCPFRQLYWKTYKNSHKREKTLKIQFKTE